MEGIVFTLVAPVNPLLASSRAKYLERKYFRVNINQGKYLKRKYFRENINQGKYLKRNYFRENIKGNFGRKIAEKNTNRG